MFCLVPVASKHGNFYITLLALVLRALSSTHAKVNGTVEEKGENRDGNGDGNGEGGPAGAEQGRERRKGRWERAGGAGGEGRIPLVGYVYTYGVAYEWDGAD